MKYNLLGNSDLNVPVITLGALNFGSFCDEETSINTIRAAIDNGVNCIDTAPTYGGMRGNSEEITAKAIKNDRDKIIIATKFGTDPSTGRSSIKGGGTKKYITHAVEESLKRLGTDYIDLYQLHWPERKTNFFGKLGYEHDDSNEWTQFEDILSDLNKFIDQGKIRHIGLSNETPWGLSKFLELSKSKNLPRMLSVQNPYNLLNRTYEVGLAEVSIREEIGLLGSKHLSEYPLFPLEKIRFQLNLDIMGSGEKGITAVNGSLFKKQFRQLSKLNKRLKSVPNVKSRGRAANSDHHFFTEKGVPGFFIYTRGYNQNYHDVNDTFENLSFNSFENLSVLFDLFLRRL